jgi:hypothetical protein
MNDEMENYQALKFKYLPVPTDALHDACAAAAAAAAAKEQK